MKRLYAISIMLIVLISNSKINAQSSNYHKGKLFRDVDNYFYYDANRPQNFEAATLWNYNENVAKRTSSVPEILKEYGDSTAIKIYPNPVQEVLNIKAAGFNIENLQIEIVDFTGRLVLKIKPKSTILQLEITNLKSGTYALYLTDCSQSVVEKFVKTN